MIIKPNNINSQSINRIPLVAKRRLVARGQAKITRLFPYSIELIGAHNATGKKSEDPEATVDYNAAGPKPQGSQGAKALVQNIRGKSHFKGPKATLQIPCCNLG